MFKVNRKLSQRGFSLIELMVAAAILAMAVFGIFHAYSTGFMGMTDARERTVATNIAREKMEEIKNTSFVDSSSYVDNVSGKQFTTTVDVIPLPTNLSNVITTVTWLDRKGDQKEIKLEMLVYDLQTSSSAVTVGSINLSADPTNVICCIGETSTIRAIVRDTAGNLVPGGTMVSFITSSGTLSADSATTWAGTGTATVTLTVGSTVATVTAFIGAVSDTVNIICALPNFNVKAVPSALASCETSTITATLTDASNNPIANQTVRFSTDKGTLSNDNATTNESGEAIVTLTSGYECMATVVASFCGETINTIINFTTPIIFVNADPEVIVLSPTTFSTITATVTDDSGNPVKDKIIEFTTDDGVLNDGTNTASVPTDNTGIATVELSNTSVGEATIQASYCSVTGKVEVITKQYSGSDYIIVSADPKEIIADGTSISTITATIYGADDSILTGYVENITFTTTLGTFSNEMDTIILTSTDYSNGIATIDLTSSTSFGIATITVSSDVLTPGSTTVTFYSNEPDHIELTANPVLVHGGISEVTAIIKKGSHTITTYVGEVDFSIIAGEDYANFLESDPVVVNIYGKAYNTLKTKDDAGFPTVLTVKASSSLGDGVTIVGYLDVPIVKIVIQLTDSPEIHCDPPDPGVGCKKIYFNIEVLGWGEDYLTVEKMKVTWPSGLVNDEEKLNKIRITGQSGWEPAWAGDVTAGTYAYDIYQRLSSGGPYTLDMSFNIDMSEKTIEVIFYTDKGDFLLELEVGAPAG